ncbi:MAG: helix-turn-helix transcriptional regulator [Christensenellaceae bacterium]|nr:helix-turn-helix transcriptional regulator [Christensenellaceae bacterium]
MIEFNRLAAGRVVRRLRKERKLSQEVFSGLAGLARSHLTMIESGSKQANFETVWRIANAFGMPPHVLVQLIEQETEALADGARQQG